MGFLGKIAGGIAGAVIGRGGGAGARQQFDTVKGVEGNLNDIYNYALPTGKAGYNAGTNVTGTGLATTGAGVNTLASPLNYWKTLASGNRPAALQALAPQTNAALTQTDAARRNAVAGGTARGGGLAAPMQQQKSDMMAQIDNMLFGARGTANQEITGIGTTEAQAGLQQADVGQSMVQKALSLLGMGGTATAAEGSLAKGTMDSQAGFTQNTVANLDNAFGGGGDYLTALAKSKGWTV